MARIVLIAFVASCIVAVSGAAGRLDRVGTAGVSVALPRGWRFFAAGVFPRSTPYGDPRIRIVAASGPVVAFPRGCKAETFRFKRHAVGVMIVEWVHLSPGSHLPPKPKRFTAKNLPIRIHAVECWPGAGGVIQFMSKGRNFAAYLLLGPGAPAALASRGRVVLDSFLAARRR